MEPKGCAETSAINYHYSLCNNPEECSSHLLHGGSLKSGTKTKFQSSPWKTLQSAIRLNNHKSQMSKPSLYSFSSNFFLQNSQLHNFGMLQQLTYKNTNTKNFIITFCITIMQCLTALLVR
jgi:hypothetical protein